MKLLLEIPYGTKALLPNTPNAGLLFQAILETRLIKSEGYGNDKKWEYAAPEQQIGVEIVQDDFMSKLSEHDPIKKLQEEKKASDSRWIEYYTKAGKLETELKELKADLDKRGITYKKEEPVKA